jgi:pimeloyl-ACP methyl ester carboxylesterase
MLRPTALVLLAGLTLAGVANSSSIAVSFTTPVLFTRAAQDTKPPNAREAKKLLDQLATVDFSKEGELEKHRQAVARLDEFHLRKITDLKAWRKHIEKVHSKEGRKLPKDSGRHWYWEKPNRGLYIVGGKTSKPKGLLIAMHGGGVGSGDAGPAHSTWSGPAEKMGWLSIAPQVLEKTERGWTDSGTEEWILALIDEALRTWKIDPNQVYLAGHSMGGYGSWTLGGHHADRVAGLAPSAGAPTPVFGPSGKIIDIDYGVVPNLRNVPMVVFQSGDDPQVPPDANRAAVERVESAKKEWGGYADFTYLEVNNRGHAGPEGGHIVLLEKIKDFKRDVIQEKLVWQPTLTWKHQFYWLWWDQPVLNSLLTAELDRSKNRIELQSKADLSGLEILLDERMVDFSKPVVISVNSEVVFENTVNPSLGTLFLTSVHPDPNLQFIARVAIPAK